MSVKKTLVWCVWFGPILITISTGRLAVLGIDTMIPFLQIIFIAIGSIFFLLNLDQLRVSKRILAILVFIFVNLCVSDPSEYRKILFLIYYAFSIHLLAKLYPIILWKQYYLVCIITSLASIVDLFSFFTTGEFLISFRDPEVLGSGFPRINSLFDEMSHQAFFMLPAVIFSLVNFDKWKILLLIGFLATQSVAAIILGSSAIILYCYRYMLKKIYFFIPLIFGFALAIFGLSEMIYGKLSIIFDYSGLLEGNQVKQVSATNILLGIEILKNIEIGSLLLGYGFFELEPAINSLLVDSPLFPYFDSVGALNDPKSNGILNLILYFGIIQVGAFGFAMWSLRGSSPDPWLYNLCLLVFLISIMKNSHTLEYIVHLWFLFGLAWCSTREISNRRS